MLKENRQRTKSPLSTDRSISANEAHSVCRQAKATLKRLDPTGYQLYKQRRWRLDAAENPGVATLESKREAYRIAFGRLSEVQPTAQEDRELIAKLLGVAQQALPLYKPCGG